MARIFSFIRFRARVKLKRKMRKNHTLFHDIFRSIKSNSSSSTWKTLLKRMEKNKEGISDRRDKTDKHDYHVREIGCKVNRIRFSGSSVERRRVSGLFRKLVRQRGWSGDARRFNLPISNAATDRVAWSLENWIRDGTFRDSRPSLRPILEFLSALAPRFLFLPREMYGWKRG